MITCDFAILPVGCETTECKDYVTAAVQVIKDSGLNYQLTGMGTQIEAENLEELYSAIAKAQEAVFEVGVGSDKSERLLSPSLLRTARVRFQTSRLKHAFI